MKTKTIKAYLVIIEIEGNWVRGTYKGNDFEAKIFTKPSGFGIDEGHVSKLWWTDIEYDRGWTKGETKKSKWLPLVQFLNDYAATSKYFEHQLEVRIQAQGKI